MSDVIYERSLLIWCLGVLLALPILYKSLESNFPSSPVTTSTLPKTGFTGPTGPLGFKGPSGATGAQGVQGVRGATGALGPTGAKGILGVQGTVGDRGPLGPLGPTGFQALQPQSRILTVSPDPIFVGTTSPVVSLSVPGISLLANQKYFVVASLTIPHNITATDFSKYIDVSILPSVDPDGSLGIMEGIPFVHLVPAKGIGSSYTPKICVSSIVKVTQSCGLVVRIVSNLSLSGDPNLLSRMYVFVLA